MSELGDLKDSSIPVEERRSERRRIIDEKVMGYQGWLRTLQNKVHAGLINEEQMFEKIARAMAAEDLLKERADLRARQDPFTGLYNRREFSTRFTQMISSGEPFGLLIIDIDHFKKVNDTHGHLAGDEVLIQTAIDIKNNTRQLRIEEEQNDIVARWGGEEFAVLLKGLSESSDIQRIAEEIRESIGNQPFEVTTEGGRKQIPITVSIGAGIFRQGDEDIFFAAVDGGLRKAKKQGRNRTVVLAT